MRLVRGAGAWWVSVGAVVALGVSGCAGPGSGGAASPSSSSTGIPEDVKVCGFLKPSEADNALGFVVTQMGYSHSPASGAEQESGTEELYCYMASESSDDPHVTMMYEPGGLINRVVYLGVGQVTVFDDAKTFENAEGFNIDGVEGEGLTLIEENRSIAMWHYPDDHVLIVQIGHAESDDAADQRPQAIALVEASVNGVVEQASKPLQEFTVYPPDSGAPAIEYATPNPG